MSYNLSVITIPIYIIYFHLISFNQCIESMMMNCFCGIVNRQKAFFSLISSLDHCERSSPSWISDTPRAGFEPAHNLSSGFVEWSCAVVITTTPLLKPLRHLIVDLNREKHIKVLMLFVTREIGVFRLLSLLILSKTEYILFPYCHLQ